MSGILMGIAIRNAKKSQMLQINNAQVTKQFGIANDFRGKPGNRQVTILSHESWLKVCHELKQDLDWTTRRANLFVRGLDLKNSVGKEIKIGDVLLRITGETDPCSRMDDSYMGLQKSLALNWRGGVCCTVIEEGEIFINQTVSIN